MYIDAGAYSTSEATLSAAFVGTATARKWKIKVSMVECGSLALPPQGCLQYHTGIAGQVILEQNSFWDLLILKLSSILITFLISRFGHSTLIVTATNT